MTEIITDGKGTGYLAGVSNENRLMISGPTTSQEHYTNYVHQTAYNTLFSVTPTGAGDVFLYIKNESPLPIICEGFNVRCVSDEIIKVTLDVSGTPSGGASVIPANLYSGSSNQAIGTFQSGNDITGLTGGTVVAEYYIAGSNESKFRNFDADIIIPQNKTLILTAVTGGILTNGFLVMWHDHSS